MGRKVQTSSFKKAHTKMKKNKSYRPPMGKRKQDEFQKNKESSSSTIQNQLPLPSNPFELKINRRKLQVLGRVKKHEIGRPYEAKSKGIAKRNRTLMKEYKTQNKTNVVIDNRLGERKKDLDEEDKHAKRAALAKSKQYRKSSIFNLNDGDDESFLTHKGFPLSQIERYDDPRDLSDSEDERLNEDFVSEANFGGFLTFKKSNQSTPTDNDFDESNNYNIRNSNGQPKSRDQIISELILQSKQRKYDKSKEMDENFEKISQLDSEFKDTEFQGLLLSYKQPTKEKKTLPSLSEIDIKLKEALQRVSEPFSVKSKDKETKSKSNDKNAKDSESTEDVDEKGPGQGDNEEDEELSNMSKEERRNFRDEKRTSELIKLFLNLVNNSFKPDKIECEEILTELHGLLVKTPHVSSNAFVKELQNIQEDFSDSHPKVLTHKMLGYFHLCLTLFQFHKIAEDGGIKVHKVLTICAALMIQIINDSKLPTIKTIESALIMLSQLHEILKESKGFCSELFRWLNTFLSIFNSLESLSDPKLQIQLGQTLNLVHQVHIQFKDLPTANDLFHPIKENLEKIKTKTWLDEHKEMSTKVTELIESLSSLPKSRLPFQFVKPKPTILKLYEPVFEENFTGVTRKKMSRDDQQRSRLAHKIKKETKSAIRELKQDNAFLARAQLKNQIALDNERKRKVSQLMGSLANQEGDYQKLKRKKK